MQPQIDILAMTLVFAGAAVFAALALFARQSLLVAYIVLGALLGPWGLGLVTSTETIQEIGHIGIIFLLYLLGLNLHPQKLVQLLGEATTVTVVSSLVFTAIGAAIALAFGFALLESVLIGVMMTFSSTIIGLKLLPTTALHHRHMGEVIISVLLLQDIIAIVILLALQGLGQEGAMWSDVALLLLSLPLLAGFALGFERWVLVKLMARFDTIHEYVFLTAIGWCLGMAELAHRLGLSHEIGAFVAGVSLATSRIAFYIADTLRPLRDFFLIMFFFSLGAGFELPVLPQVAAPALALGAAMIVVKPAVFKALLVRAGESPRFSWEVGMRLGQTSEFSLLIAVLAVQAGVIGDRVSYLVQAATLCTFIVSSYLVMLRFPTPIAVSDKLRRD